MVRKCLGLIRVRDEMKQGHKLSLLIPAMVNEGLVYQLLQAQYITVLSSLLYSR